MYAKVIDEHPLFSLATPITPVFAAFKYVEIVYILLCYSFIFTRCLYSFISHRSGEAAVDYSNGVVAMLDERRPGGFLKPLLDFSLLCGLPLMQTEDVKKLANKIGVTHALRTPPRNDKQWVTSLLKFRFADISDDAISAIIKLRAKELEKTAEVNAGNLLSANADILQGAMDEDEMDDMQNIITKHRESLAKTAAANFTRPSMAGISSFRENDIDIKDVQPLAPLGFTVYKDTTLHHRWKLECKLPKACHTKTYGGRDGFSEKQALRHCLRLAWKTFTATEDGYPCPHDLDNI